MSEKEHAVVLANKILDRPSGDPDDDLAVLARQFLRAREALQWIADQDDNEDADFDDILIRARRALSTPDIQK